MEIEASSSSPSSSSQFQGTTFFRTCINGLNALSGVGLITIPYAVSKGGWLSLMLFLVLSVICCYTGILLQRCMEAHPHIKTYPDIGVLAFGRIGRYVVSLFMYFELYLVAIEFLILEGDNLAHLFPKFGFNILGIRFGGKHGFIILSALVVLPTTWLRNLGLLAYVSAGGVLASIAIVCCVFWAGAVDGVGFHEKGTVIDWGGMSTAISVFAFCFCGHAVFPTLCSSMKKRHNFSKVLIICFVVATCNYGAMAVLGYLMYGQGVKSQITLNLPSEKLNSRIAIYTTLISPFTKYAIIINPIVTAIEARFPYLSNSRAASIVLRTLVVMTTVIVALTVPFFAYLMAFIGAFLSVTVSLLLPCICYLKISLSSGSSFRLEFAIIFFIIVLGSVVAVLGTFTSIRDIVSQIHN